MEEPQVFINRTYRLALIIAGVGIGFFLVLGKGDWAWGFGVGSGISMANFALITWAASRAFNPKRGSRPRHPWKGSIFRFLLTGIILFFAIFFLKLNFFALAIGLIVSQISMCSSLLLWEQARNGDEKRK